MADAPAGPANGGTNLRAEQPTARVAEGPVTPERPSQAPFAGVAVKLQGLVGAAEHNGKRAAVLDFVAAKGRFKLELEDGGKRLSVKPANFELAAAPAGLAIEVVGLVGAPQHNGKRGTVAGGPDVETGRYTIRLPGGGKPLGLKPGNLALVTRPVPKNAAEAADQALAERLQREGSGLTAGGAGNARARVRAGPNARTEAHFLTIGGRRVAFEPAVFGPQAAALPPTAAVPAAPELAEPS